MRYDDEMDYEPMHFDRRYEDSRRYEDNRRSSSTGRYMNDRHSGSGKQLSEEHIDRWIRSLMGELEEKDRQQLKMDNAIRRAKEMGISFDKFTEEEFYVTMLMLHTDLAKAFGTMVTLDHWVKAAKAWLCDPDAALRYGKKLAAYYHAIVEDYE
jgi:hypothetical protein